MHKEDKKPWPCLIVQQQHTHTLHSSIVAEFIAWHGGVGRLSMNCKFWVQALSLTSFKCYHSSIYGLYQVKIRRKYWPTSERLLQRHASEMFVMSLDPKTAKMPTGNVSLYSVCLIFDSLFFFLFPCANSFFSVTYLCCCFFFLPQDSFEKNILVK